jgi:hypothetical protein
MALMPFAQMYADNPALKHDLDFKRAFKMFRVVFPYKEL